MAIEYSKVTYLLTRRASEGVDASSRGSLSPSLARRVGVHDTQPRRGMTIAEVAVALVLLGVAMAALIQFVGLSARQRHENERRRIALQEVANQAERLALA